MLLNTYKNFIVAAHNFSVCYKPCVKCLYTIYIQMLIQVSQISNIMCDDDLQ